MKTDINKELQKLAKDFEYVSLFKTEEGWSIDCQNIDVESRSIDVFYGKGKTPLQAIKNIGKA